MATRTWKCESQQHEYFSFFVSQNHVALNARVGPGVEEGGSWHSARALSVPPM